MCFVIESLTPPPYSWFGLNFKRNKIISHFLNQQHGIFVFQDKQKTQIIDFEKAAKLLYQGIRISRIAPTFTLRLHFDTLRLSDETLTLDCEAHIKVTNPELFFNTHAPNLDTRLSLATDSFSSRWSEVFYNAVELICRKDSYSNWKIHLTPGELFNTIQTYFDAPFAKSLTAGIELCNIDSIHAFSPSMETKLKEEIEQKKIEEQNAHQKQEQEKLKLELQEKEQQLKQLQEERLRQEEFFKKHEEQERIRNEQQKQTQQQRDRILIEYKNRWSSLSDTEKVLAGQLSEFFQKQAEANPIELCVPAAKKQLIEIDFCQAEWNTLSYGASLAFSFTASQNGFITVLNLGTSGRITALLPNSATGSDKDIVRMSKGTKYQFPQTFLKPFPDDIFAEGSNSGLEGIYVLITPEPLIPVRYTGQLNELPNVSYKHIMNLLNSLKDLPTNSWSVGILEFQVVDQ